MPAVEDGQTGTMKNKIGPDFLCVGARKAGTTWLYKYLESHPEVYLPPVKEINFFNSLLFRENTRTEDFKNKQVEKKWSTFQEKWDNSYKRRDNDTITPATPPSLDELDEHNWYLQLFTRPAHLKSGDISPLYQNVDQHEIEAAHKLIPDAKIIYILRDPVRRLWSDFVMEYSKSKYDLTLIGPEQALNLLMAQTVRGFSFSSKIRYWKEIYGEQLKVFFFEDFINDVEGYVNDICDFIEITPYPELAHQIENPNPGRKIPMPSYVQKAISRVVLPELEALNEVFPHPTVNRWLETASKEAKKALY